MTALDGTTAAKFPFATAVCTRLPWGGRAVDSTAEERWRRAQDTQGPERGEEE